MSGGGGKKKEPEATPSEPMPTRTVQPFIGDNQNLLAQQLAAGGYGDIASILASFQQTYAPMEIPDYSPDAQPAPSTPAPAAPAIGKGRGNRGSYDWYANWGGNR